MKQTDIKKVLTDAPKLQLRGIYFAGPVVTALACGLAYMLVYGKPWPVTLYPRIVDALAYSLFGCIGIIALVVIALSSGLINSLNISVGALKASVNLDDDDPPSQQPRSSTPVGEDPQPRPSVDPE